MSFSDFAVAYGEYCSVLNDAVTQAEDDIWVNSWISNSMQKKIPFYEKMPKYHIFMFFGKDFACRKNYCHMSYHIVS